jgi:maleate isomerase
VDVIVYGCTTGSLVGGVRWEEDLVDRLHDNTGIRTMSTSGAVVGALRALSARRVGVATPYTDVLNRLETEFLEDHGFQVAAVEGLGLVNNLEIGRVEGGVIEGLVEAVAGEADTIFVSCTNLPALDLIDGLERRHGRPVVTSNQASLWAALRDSSVKAIIGYGELLRDRL